MRAIIKAAFKIDELAYDLDNIATDDKKKVEDYTDSEILHEAKHVLGLFLDETNPHWNNEDLRGENGPEQKLWARGEVRKLKAFIKKYS
jgi:hypothetical protein